MIIREIKQKKEWEDFLTDCYPKTFLQSWNWGEFSKLMGQRIWRLGVYENECLILTSLIVKISAKRGVFLMAEHGPNTKLKSQNEKLRTLEILLSYLKELGRAEKVDFIRICPIWENKEENIRIFKDLGFRPAPIHMHPEISWILDIVKSEEELLSSMRKTTRYLIGQAQKNKEIEIIKSENKEDLKVFFELYKKTSARQNFVPFSLNYLEKELESFLKDNNALIFLGRYRNEIMASAIIIYWQNFGFYHQGASDTKHSKIPVSYLLQWEAIKEAKKRRCDYYSFWGIAPEDKKNHPWAGLSLFKKGFGGRKEEYLKTADYVLSNKYWLNFFVEKMRKIKRHL